MEEFVNTIMIHNGTILDGPITEKKQKRFQHIRLDSIDDLAFTLQKFTIDKIKEFVYPSKVL